MEELQEKREENSQSDHDTTKTLDQIRSLIQTAFRKGTSDIHLEVKENYANVKFRIHGELRPHIQWKRSRGIEFCSALYNSVTDVSETTFNPQASQDARISDEQYLPEGLHSIRVGTAPTEQGFIMVMRLMEKELDDSGGLEPLGYHPRQINDINYMQERSAGLNLVTGPTGSGKSTTLKRVLRQVMEDRDYKINTMTVEDPPERPIEGAVQTPITDADDKEERTEKFNQRISALMRLDPDVIMIGEVRDEASASLAVRAAMTGHQVWTTLHTYSAFGAIDRLQDLGVPLDMIAKQSLLTGSMFQRLVKTLCENCRVPYASLRPHLDVNGTGSQSLNGKPSLGDSSQQFTNSIGPDFGNNSNNGTGHSNGHAKETGHVNGKGQPPDIDIKKKEDTIYRLREGTDINMNGVYFRGPGCDECDHTGVSGRTLIAEVLQPDKRTMELIREGNLDDAEEFWVEEMDGMTIVDHALLKIEQGLIDPESVEKIIGHLASVDKQVKNSDSSASDTSNEEEEVTDESVVV
jgi:type II secretory ATPase GspE/PulE/Tfp pilus assembly ATPase PilB-like protein